MAEKKIRSRIKAAPTTQASGGKSKFSELDVAQAEIKAAFGDETIRRADVQPRYKHIPTGIFTLDMALLGGIPQSQVSLLYGREASGKSTLAYRIMGQAQAKFPDQAAVLVDVEGTYDDTWAKRHGIVSDRLFVVQPITGEQALDATERMVRSLDTAIVVVDSLAALLPYKEAEGSVEDQQPGMQARMIGKFVRKITSAMLEERKRGHLPTILLLNQWRYKIGVFRGDPRVLPGGQAQHYAASCKIEILNKEHLGRDQNDFETVDHNQHSFKIAKNKMGVAIRNGEFTMVRNPANPMGQGFIDDGRTVATWAKKLGLVTGAGSHWKIDGVDQKFGKLDEIVAYFYEDMERYFEFQHRVISKYREENGLLPDGWL